VTKVHWRSKPALAVKNQVPKQNKKAEKQPTGFSAGTKSRRDAHGRLPRRIPMGKAPVKKGKGLHTGFKTSYRN